MVCDNRLSIVLKIIYVFWDVLKSKTARQYEMIVYAERDVWNSKFHVCLTVNHWYSNINSQLDATITVH